MTLQLIEQKKNDLLNLQATIQMLNQVISKKKSIILQLQADLNEAKEIEGLNVLELNVQLTEIKTKKLSVIPFNYLVAKKIDLEPNEILTWEQASKADYENNITAYLLKTRNMTSALRNVPYGIGSTAKVLGEGFRYFAGTYRAGVADVTPAAIMEKLRNVVKKQLIIRLNKTQLNQLNEEVSHLEQELLDHAKEKLQLEIDLQLLNAGVENNAAKRITIKERAETSPSPKNTKLNHSDYLTALLGGFMGALLGWSLGAYVIGPLLAPFTMGLSLILAPIFCIMIGGIIGFAVNLTSDHHYSSESLPKTIPNLTHRKLFLKYDLKPTNNPTREHQPTPDEKLVTEPQPRESKDTPIEIERTIMPSFRSTP